MFVFDRRCEIIGFSFDEPVVVRIIFISNDMY